MVKIPCPKYDASSIEVLRGIEGIRNNPTMYIGSTGSRGLHHLLWEIIDNSVDEALEGFGKKITITITALGTICVEDLGRGIPVGIHKQEQVSALDLVLTEIHAGGKLRNRDSDGSYTASGGVHGIGASAVNALSEWMKVTIKRDGQIYYRDYDHGVAQGRKIPRKGSKTNRTGTKIEFSPDPEIFTTTQFDPPTIIDRLIELSFLTPHVEFVFRNKCNGDKDETFKSRGGLGDFVQHLSAEMEGIFPAKPITFSGQNGSASVSFALLYAPGEEDEILRSYANNIRTESGGTHVSGFRNALTRAVNIVGKEMKITSAKDGNLSGEEIRTGIVSVLLVRVPEPQFEGQTKERLCNSDVEASVSSLTQAYLMEYFRAHRSVLRKIIGLAVTSRKAKEAAKRSAKLVRQKSGPIRSILPGKLTHCISRTPKETELFIVEGDSAAGPAKQARDAHTQAVLPLRGKIINVEKAGLSQVLGNAEISAIISACGCGVQNKSGEGFSLDSLRYHKIVIAMDADVDGMHIRTLLLTFFFRYMKPLIEMGHLYVAQPPLYCLEHGGKRWYFQTDEDLAKSRKKRGALKRFKGLGEMNVAEFKETCMDPQTRGFVRVTIEDAEEANEMIRSLMGSDVDVRRGMMAEFKQRERAQS